MKKKRKAQICKMQNLSQKLSDPFSSPHATSKFDFWGTLCFWSTLSHGGMGSQTISQGNHAGPPKESENCSVLF